MVDTENDAKENTAKENAAKENAEESPELLPFGKYGQKLSDAGFEVVALQADAAGNESIQVDPAHLIQVATFLRDQCDFDLLLSCAGVDWKTHRESVYQVYSIKASDYIILKVIAKEEHSPSLMPVWPAADWHERETYDLFGIIYDGHPNLTRILMPNDWLGHPLRKDYKLDDPRLVWNQR
ncbi:MAG: NADH-quinone oxidoreductase subunit C [Cyanobacteria bacterium P01_H01_bin.74]